MFEMAQTSGSEGLRPLNVIEASITLHKEQATRGFLGIGRDLIDAKAQIGQHGQWMPWLERMGFNQSTANKYMQVARAVSEGSALEGLSFSQISALLALPAGEREAFVLENGVADKSGAEIKKLIAERDQLKKERDEARENWNTYQGSAIHWKQEADFRAQRIEELQNAEPRTVKVVETPDDYQQLKMAAAHHQAEMEEAAQAAEEAEQRAAAAEAELARMRREQGGQGRDRYQEIAGKANDFLLAARMLPWDAQEMGSEANRRRYELLMKPIREWVLDMQQALQFGPLDAEGAVI